MDDEMRQRLVSLVRATHRGGVNRRTSARARARLGAPRRVLPRRPRRRDAGSGEGTGGRARSCARSGPRRASAKTGFRHAMDGWHPPDARARGRGEERARRHRRCRHPRRAHEHPARVSRVGDGPGRPSRRRARRSERARTRKTLNTRSRCDRARRDASSARRGDGAVMAISETGDVRVPSCVTLTTTSRAAPARRIEGRRVARPAYFGILAFVKTRMLQLAGPIP